MYLDNIYMFFCLEVLFSSSNLQFLVQIYPCKNQLTSISETSFENVFLFFISDDCKRFLT